MKASKLISLIIFILFLGLFYACSRNSDKETTIKFWAMGSEAEYVTKLVPEVEKRNPGIKVKVQAVPWNAAQEKLITAFASDNTPDACQLGNTWVPQFTYLNAITNLDEYINGSSVVKKENYFEGIWDTNVLDSLVYGVPWYVDTRLIFYRTDIFERAGYKQPPKSWDELYDLCKKIKALFPGEEKYAIYLPTNEWPPFIIFGLQNNASLLKDNNTRAYFNPGNLKNHLSS